MIKYLLGFTSFYFFKQCYSKEIDEIYKCAACISIIETKVIVNEDFHSICEQLFDGHTQSICSILSASKHTEVAESIVSSSDARKICTTNGFCQELSSESWRSHLSRLAASSGTELDIRVSKALGSKGYDKVRLSIISNSTIDSEYLSYSGAFQNKWTSNDLIGKTYLSSGVVTITPGTLTTFNINGVSVDVTIPKEDAGIRGIIMADPCFQSEWITCAYKDKWDTFNRQTQLINAAMEKDDADFFQILGDNFYDRGGSATATWFAALSQKAKSKVMATVPGNHDFWALGSPYLWVPNDQLASGLMQTYGQDVMASKADDAQPYDFSGISYLSRTLPHASNFFFYNKLGNVVFIGWSGAHEMSEQDAYFNEACAFASESNPAAVVLVSHWHKTGYGCASGMSSPEIYADLKSRPACQSVASKLRYFEGHEHCNYIPDAGVGFMIGAAGMSDTECDPQFGFIVLDTTNQAFMVYYFALAQGGTNTFDNSDAIISCIATNGVSGCYHMATLWYSGSL